MENLPRLLDPAFRSLGAIDRHLQFREDWRLVRSAHMDLDLARMRRLNLLLIGPQGVIQSVLELMMPGFPAPIVWWRPGQRLVLPPTSSSPGTMILHDVEALTCEEQRRVFEWLEQGMDQRQVISTTSGPLVELVQAGAFSNALYYRLNTVCVELDT